MLHRKAQKSVQCVRWRLSRDHKSIIPYPVSRLSPNLLSDAAGSCRWILPGLGYLSSPSGPVSGSVYLFLELKPRWPSQKEEPEIWLTVCRSEEGSSPLPAFRLCIDRCCPRLPNASLVGCEGVPLRRLDRRTAGQVLSKGRETCVFPLGSFTCPCLRTELCCTDISVIVCARNH